MTRFSAFLIFFIGSINLFSQEELPLKFDNTFLNVGNIIDYEFQKFSFKVKNISDKPVSIKLKNKTFHINYKIDKQVIKPGEKAKVVMEFYPEKIGVFQETLFLEDDQENAYQLKILGYITSLSDKYKELDKDNSLRGDKDVIFIVIDAETLEPLPNTTLNIRGVNNNVNYERETDELGALKGRYPDGSYDIEGYFNGVKKTIVGTEVDVGKNVVMILMGNDEEKEAIIEMPKTKEVELIEEIVVPEEYESTPLENDSKYVDQRIPLHLTLMIDISGSMNINDRIVKLKKSLKHLIVNYQDVDQLSIVTFNDSVYVNHQMKSIKDKHKVLYFIDNIDPSGNTQGVSSLNSVINIIGNTTEKEALSMILLSTDGELTSNGYEDKVLLGKIDKLKKQGVLFSVLAFSKSTYSQNKLRKMASIGGGIFINMNAENIEEDIILKSIKLLLDKN